MDRRQTMLLLTTLTFGGQDETRVFRYLPEAEAELLRQKAEALAALPSERRVAFMVREMRKQLEERGRRGAEFADPSWHLAKMHGESPRVIATLFLGLPKAAVKGVYERLPPKVRAKLPRKSEVREVDPEVQRHVRNVFEERFADMTVPTGLTTFSLDHLIVLDTLDMLKLLRALGLEELAQAFVSLGKRALVSLYRRLEKRSGEELIAAVKAVHKDEAMDLKNAQRFIAYVLESFKGTEDLFQKAGLFRLARALQYRGAAQNLAVAQRLPRSHGKLLLQYIEKVGEIAEMSELLRYRLEDSMTRRVIQLSRHGVLNPTLARLEPRLWADEVDLDALAAESAREEAERRAQEAAERRAREQAALKAVERRELLAKGVLGDDPESAWSVDAASADMRRLEGTEEVKAPEGSALHRMPDTAPAPDGSALHRRPVRDEDA